MLTYNEVARHLPGTNAQVASRLNADQRHLRDAPIGPLRRVLLESGLIVWAGFDGISGIMAVAYDSLGAGAKQIADQFLTDLVTDAAYPAATPAGGRRIEQVIALATAQEEDLEGGYTAESFAAALTTITGGRRYGAVTAQEVADVIAAEAARLERETLITDYETATGLYVDLHTQTRAQVVAGLRSAADHVESPPEPEE